MKMWKIKYKLKQLFCRHKNRVEIDRESRLHGGGMKKILHITYYCHDCGKIFEVMVE